MAAGAGEYGGKVPGRSPGEAMEALLVNAATVRCALACAPEAVSFASPAA
jgi:hypothetical protein